MQNKIEIPKDLKKKLSRKSNNSKTMLRNMLFYSSLFSFSECTMTLFEEEETSDIHESLRHISFLAKKELNSLSFRVDIKDHAKILTTHEYFYSSYMENSTYSAVFLFFQDYIDGHMIGSNGKNGRKVGCVTKNDERLSRLEKLHGLILTVADMIAEILKQSIEYTEDQYIKDCEKAKEMSEYFAKTFERIK